MADALQSSPRPRRAYGSGSVYPVTDKAGRTRWIGSWQVIERDGSPGRRYCSGKTRAEVEAKMARRTFMSRRDRSADQRVRKLRVNRMLEWIPLILAEQRARGWTDAMTARVLIAQLAVKRVRDGVFGPCIYCGTWLADTIEHPIPLNRGGIDCADNRASACYSCNSRKQDKTAEEFVA